MRSRPASAVDLVGHSLGGNVVMLYAGARPARVRRVVSLEGFGIPAEDAGRAPKKIAAWLDALAAPPDFAPYANLDAVADRLQKNNPRLPRDGGELPRFALGGDAAGRHARAFVPIRATSCPSRRPTASRRRSPSGGRSSHRRCGSPPRNRRSRSGSSDHPEGEAGADGLDGIRRRMAHIPRCTPRRRARRVAHAASRPAGGRGGRDRGFLAETAARG